MGDVVACSLMQLSESCRCLVRSIGGIEFALLEANSGGGWGLLVNIFFHSLSLSVSLCLCLSLSALFLLSKSMLFGAMGSCFMALDSPWAPCGPIDPAWPLVPPLGFLSFDVGGWPMGL